MKASLTIGWFIFLVLGGFFLAFAGSVDDAHITYWSAWILAHQGELLNYNYERVEQSSTLLQVIILAALHKLTSLSVVTLGHVFIIIISMLTIMSAGFAAKKCRDDMVEPAILLLATSPFFVYWAYGGMEGPLLALILLLHLFIWESFLKTQGGFLRIIALSITAQLARPEMVLVCILSAALLLSFRFVLPAWRVLKIKSFFILLLVQVLSAGLILSLRYAYFHDWWPQPVAAKAGSDFLAQTLMGLQYAWLAVSRPGLMLPSVLAITSLCYVVICGGRKLPLSLHLLIAVVLAVVYTLFVITSGGDWMAAGRFWVPVIPLYVILIAYMLVSCIPQLAWRRCVIVAVLSGHVFYLWQGASTEFNAIPLWKQDKLLPSDSAADYSYFERHGREHLHDIPTLAFLKPLIRQIQSKQGGEQPLRIMVGQAGMVLYYLGIEFPGYLRITDRNGLVERTFTNCEFAKILPRTRNGLGNGYEWIMTNKAALAQQCGFIMPDIIFDITTAWNKKNTDALRQNGYVVIYEQRGHIINDDALLPVRKIGAGQYVAVSAAIYSLIGAPETIHRIF